ncbi:hypothetical protein [Hymenobacter arizonensis]|uniref:hypothetical protein n=1 Tax=Hymenobacter arizonensis TaxID=1227077 RepID=UPI001160319F|nr:hypothetical protein [Hymenobacter arizonensis]
MNFRTLPFSPAAGAVGVASRVQLPMAARSAIFHPELSKDNYLPRPSTGAAQDRQRTGPSQHRAQHRAQCRAMCMSKANF